MPPDHLIVAGILAVLAILLLCELAWRQQVLSDQSQPVSVGLG